MTEHPYGTTAAPPAFTPNGALEPSSSPSLSDKAGDTAEAGKQAATDVAQTAADKAKDVAHETKKQARDLVGEARSQLTEQAGAQHRNLVTNLNALADELSTMAERSDNGGIATDLVSQAGDHAKNAAGWLDQREPGDLLGEVRTFARQRPGTFLLGAALAGVVVGRLTRGAVAAHTDDDASPAVSSGSSAGVNAAAPTTVLPAAAPAAPYAVPHTAPVAPSPFGSSTATMGAGASPSEGAYSVPPTGYGTGVVGEPTP